MTVRAIETLYRGCRFRSRLEARWACFWDYLGIRWEYEPQGFMIGDHPYLPDFRLSNGTWVEIKGSEEELDYELMMAAPLYLPSGGSPHLLILGPIPEPPKGGNWAWLGLDAAAPPGDEMDIFDDWYEFGEDGVPCHARETSSAPPVTSCGYDEWLLPVINMTATPDSVVAAYKAARSARFEHGESGVR